MYDNYYLYRSLAVNFPCQVFWFVNFHHYLLFIIKKHKSCEFYTAIFSHPEGFHLYWWLFFSAIYYYYSFLIIAKSLYDKNGNFRILHHYGNLSESFIRISILIFLHAAHPLTWAWRPFLDSTKGWIYIEILLYITKQVVLPVE